MYYKVTKEEDNSFIYEKSLMTSFIFYEEDETVELVGEHDDDELEYELNGLGFTKGEPLSDNCYQLVRYPRIKNWNKNQTLKEIATQKLQFAKQVLNRQVTIDLVIKCMYDVSRFETVNTLLSKYRKYFVLDENGYLVFKQ